MRSLRTLVAAFELGRAAVISRLNNKLVSSANEFQAGIVVVTNDYYSDPDKFTNKFITWADLFCKMTGLQKYKWYWQKTPVDVNAKEAAKLLNMDGKKGMWTVQFTGPLFDKWCFGPLVFFASDSNLGYSLDAFSHLSPNDSSSVFSDAVQIPNSMTSSKDVVKLIVKATLDWLGDELDEIKGVADIELKHVGGQFKLGIKFTAAAAGETSNLDPNNPAVKRGTWSEDKSGMAPIAEGVRIATWLWDAGFTDVKASQDGDEINYTFSCPLAMFS